MATTDSNLANASARGSPESECAMHFSRIQGKRVFNSALSVEAPHERTERLTVENMPNSAFAFSNLGSSRHISSLGCRHFSRLAGRDHDGFSECQRGSKSFGEPNHTNVAMMPETGVDDS